MSADLKPKSYKELLAWQKGTALVKSIYALTRKFPQDERFGLTGQIRRAAVSIPSNLAEGQARPTIGEFIQFISQAEGSLAELETQLRLSLDLSYCSESDVISTLKLMEELRKMQDFLAEKEENREDS